MGTTSLKDSLSALTKRYGKTVAFMGSDIPTARKIPTGIPMVDYALTGGFAVNRITEIYGPYSSLKSYLTYCAIARFQKYDWGNDVPDVIAKVTTKIEKSKSKDASFDGFTFASVDKVTTRRGYKPINPVKVKRAVLIDIEGTYDREWGAKLGIDNDLLIYLSPDSLNVTIDIMDTLLRDEEISLIILDSMSAIGSDAEADSSMENEQMAVNARLWNKATRKIQGAMNSNTDKDITVIAINRSYSKVGFVLGDPEKVANGEAFSLAKAVSIKMSTTGKVLTGKIEGTEVAMGRNIKIANKKNKVGVPFREGTFYYSYIDDGTIKKGQTDIVSQLIELGLQFDIIEKKGNSYVYHTAKAVGMENFKEALRSDSDSLDLLSKAVYKFISM